jgi:hypothetical protein
MEGTFLADNQFGSDVVFASTGKQGDAQKDLPLAGARAMVIREYPVENLGLDDSQFKRLAWASKRTQTRPRTGAVSRFSSSPPRAPQTPAAQLFLRFRFQEAGPNLDGAHSKAFVCGVMRHAAIFLRPETEGQVQIESAAMERS